MKKDISVIVPVYNVSNYLKRCIESVLNQTFEWFEVILVDDGSTDDSLEICNRYKYDSRVSVIHKENGGLSSARNVGIENSECDYIVFIDSDDWIHKDYLKRLYELVNRYNADIAQVGYWATKYEKCILPSDTNGDIAVMNGEEAVKRSCIYPENVRFNITWNKIYKKSLFKEIRFPEGRIHEDEFTSYRLFYKAKQVVDSDEKLYFYYKHVESITGEKTPKRLFDRYLAFEQKLFELSNWGLYDEYKIVLRGYYFRLVQDRTLGKYDDEILEVIDKKIRELRKNIVKEYGPEMIRPYTPKFCYRLNEDRILKNTKSKRIAIYGAGNVGKNYYEQLSGNCYVEVTAWVDSRWYIYQEQGYPVEGIDELLHVDFDLLIIAIENERMAEKIADELSFSGIDKHKLVWIKPEKFIMPYE